MLIHLLRDATVNNYKPQNEKQVQAKQTAIEYVQGFSTKEPKSLILQGSYGTGKSHLAYAIAKAVKAKGHTVAYAHTNVDGSYQSDIQQKCSRDYRRASQIAK